LVPSIEVIVNPKSVWITLEDRELRIGYNLGSHRFVGEEAAHSWYNGEAYSDRYEWDTAEARIESLIRLCAKYVRMAVVVSRTCPVPKAWTLGDSQLIDRLDQIFV